MAEFPKELLGRPLPLVALVGLDSVRNAVHRMIWHSFTAERRSDRTPINFKNFPGDHEYPKPKPKKSTYDQYIPPGVLKRKWLGKHLFHVPAVVVVFFDLDWDDPQWKERQIECASRVEVVRASLQERNTRVALVLIQTRSLNPSGDDMVARERAASLCHACKLPSSSLFVLPHTDRLMGYIARLEVEFYELAQKYYQGEAGAIKSRKEFLNKPTQLLLFVRHQFKIAFFSEIRQDSTSALNHYIQAYRDLSEATANDPSLLEIKLLAGFLNYKICKHYFRTNQPRDAITQFRRHIDYYKDLRGYRLLEFEHFAWLHKQFSLFGDLFQNAVERGLDAIQIQHPGFYYHQAANYITLRRASCQKLCNSTAHAKASLEVKQHYTDYFGVRPWRVGLKETEPSSEEEQSVGIFSLQAKEVTTDYCKIRVDLLSYAINRFKQHRSNRMRQWLFVQMGKEHYAAKDYIEALKFFQKAAGNYRKERWWHFLIPILLTSLKCAYLMADWQQYVTLALELAGKQSVGLSEEEQTRVLKNLTRIISNDLPESEPDCDPEAIDKAEALWKEEEDAGTPSEGRVIGHRFVIIPMKGLSAFVQCKAGFEKPAFSADSPVTVIVHLRSTSTGLVSFSKLSVFFSNEAYNQHCIITGSQDQDSTSDLSLVPGEIITMKLNFAALSDDVDKQIQISSVTLEMGSIATGRCAVLSWEGGGLDASFECVTPVGRGDSALHSPTWSALVVHSQTSINRREPLVSVELVHNPPALLNEKYPLKAVVKFQETAEITNVKFLLGLKENSSESSSARNDYVCLDEPPVNPSVKRKFFSVEFRSLDGHSTIERKLFFHSGLTGTKTIAARVVYNIEVSVDPAIGNRVCSCVKGVSAPVEIIPPFDINLTMSTLKFETIYKVNCGEPFVLMTNVHGVSPWPITIKTTKFDMLSPVKTADKEIKSQLEGLTIAKNDVISECQCLVVPCIENVPRAASLGTYSLTWHRSSCTEEDCLVTTELALPTAVVEKVPFWIETKLPPFGLQSAPVLVTYKIHNQTNRVQEFQANFDPSDSFVFSGHKMVSFRILPDSDFQLTSSLFPLASGNLQLPRLHIDLPGHRMAGNCEPLVQRLVPTHLFVKPSGTAVKEVIPLYC